MIRQLHVNHISDWLPSLRAGEEIELSGVVYTARDAAHKRFAQAIAEGRPLPFDPRGAVIYYAGPTPTPPGKVCGSFGPTTSGRMDEYAPTLYDMGLACTIGKGERSEAVRKAIAKNKAAYLISLGGAGALAASKISSMEVIAYEDLDCESVKRLEFANFPLIVGIDPAGASIFDHS